MKNSFFNVLFHGVGRYWFFIVLLTLVLWGVYLDNSNVPISNTATIPAPAVVPSTPPSTTDTNQEIDPVTQADYSEGYKAGYVDGRASKGTLGDSYSEPATEERKGAYQLGYLSGFLKGCREGGFDCSAVEDAINQLDQSPSSTVNLIPSSDI